MYLIYLEENFRENVKTCMSLFDKFSTNELKKIHWRCFVLHHFIFPILFRRENNITVVMLC